MADILHRNPRGTAAAWACLSRSLSPRTLTARVRLPLARSSGSSLRRLGRGKEGSRSGGEGGVAEGARARRRQRRSSPLVLRSSGPQWRTSSLSPTSAPGRPDLPLSRLTSTHTSPFPPPTPATASGSAPRRARHRGPETGRGREAGLDCRRMRGTRSERRAPGVVSPWLEATEAVRRLATVGEPGAGVRGSMLSSF